MKIILKKAKMKKEKEKEKRRAKNTEYYKKIARYLKHIDKIEDEENDIKIAVLEYVIENGKLFIKENIAVIYDSNNMQKIIEIVHKDLEYYKKLVTKEVVKKRYIVARDV
jgi:hypothetical protein